MERFVLVTSIFCSTKPIDSVGQTSQILLKALKFKKSFSAAPVRPTETPKTRNTFDVQEIQVQSSDYRKDTTIIEADPDARNEVQALQVK